MTDTELPVAGDGRKRWGPTPFGDFTGRLIWTPVLRGLFRYKTIGLENVPKRGPLLFVANHASNLDPMLVALPIRHPIAFLGKAELFDNKIAGAILRSWGTYPLHRDRADISAVRLAMRIIRDEGMLCIFPEGTRTRDGKLQDFKVGTSKLALKLRAPIVAVGITGSYKAFGRNSKVPQFGTPITISYSKPFELDWDAPATAEHIQRITQMFRERVSALLV